MSRCIAFTIFLILAPLTFAAEDEAIEVAKKIAIGGGVADFEANASAIADLMVSRAPELARHRDYLANGILELLNSSEMHTKVAMVYVENFTYEELLEFEKLLSNPAMVAWLQRMPTVMPAILDAQRSTLESGLIQLVQSVPE